MIEATESKQERKTSDSQMGFWDRRRHIKEAKSMLRVGAQVELPLSALQQALPVTPADIIKA